LFCALLLWLGFDHRNFGSGKPQLGNFNAISSLFYFWSWGCLFTAVCVGSASIPRERRTPMLFTLPLTRWELALGKLIGAQLLSAAFLALGFGLSSGLAVLSGVPVTAYSGLSFATALTVSFVYLCLSIPLGAWLSPVIVGTITVIAEAQSTVVEGMAKAHLISGNGLTKALGYLLPWTIPGEPIRGAFFHGTHASGADFAGLLLNAFFGVIFFIGLTFLMRRGELSMRDSS